MLMWLWLFWVFILGTAIGSYLNVCIARLPLEKSTFWPGSRCGQCLQPIRWYDNIPLLSYWLLGGRCRSCGTRFSVRYFLIELGTGLAFAGLFYLEIVLNVHQWPILGPRQFSIEYQLVPWQGWVLFGYHAILFCFLLVASICDLDHREIPLAVTIPGTILGLVGAVLWPWPWPYQPAEALPRDRPVAIVPMDGIDRDSSASRTPWWQLNPHLDGPRSGLYPWPVWGPLPSWLPPRSWQLGLATGLFGMLAGTFILRAIAFLFGQGLRKEALGLGDADLMMMAGSFLGWQPVVVAFFIGVFPGLFYGLVRFIFCGDRALPFGPGLATGVLLTWLGWYWIAPGVQLLFFWDMLLLCVLGFGGVFMLASGYFLRWTRLASERGKMKDEG